MISGCGAPSAVAGAAAAAGGLGRHGGGHPVAEQAPGDQQHDRTCAAHRDDHGEHHPTCPQGQRARDDADGPGRQHRGGGDPVGQRESRLRAQRRGGADAGEPVARQPPPPAEQADDQQCHTGGDQQHPEQSGR